MELSFCSAYKIRNLSSSLLRLYSENACVILFLSFFLINFIEWTSLPVFAHIRLVFKDIYLVLLECRVIDYAFLNLPSKDVFQCCLKINTGVS